VANSAENRGAAKAAARSESGADGSSARLGDWERTFPLVIGMSAYRWALVVAVLAGIFNGLFGCSAGESRGPAPADPLAEQTGSMDGQLANGLGRGAPRGDATGREVQTSPAGADSDQLVVRLRIARPGVEPEVGEVSWREEMTVFDALDRFSPSLNVESTGQGESLFVKSIGGQPNLGASGDNWIYRVNGKLGDRSCGLYQVSPGDEIVWSFGKYE